MSVLQPSRRRIALVASFITVAVLLLSGCQVGGYQAADTAGAATELPPLSELTPIDDPTSWQGPSTAVIGGPTLAPVAEDPEQHLPATVLSKDKFGDVEVRVTDASRVIALSITGTVAELVQAYGLADTLVGRDISTELPGLQELPVVTKQGHSIDAEAVLALNPSLIITDGTIGPTDVVLQLRDAGITVVTVTRAVDATTTYETARQVADALGVPELAEPLVSQLQQAITAKEAEIATLAPADERLRPRVAFLYIRGNAGIYYLFGEGSGIDSLITSLGAIDVAQEIGWVGERPMTDEALVALDPDILIVLTNGLKSAGGVDGLLASNPAIALTTAGANRRIVDVDDGLLFAGGTRIPDVLDGLARAIYAPNSL